jgi:hypothetical protein|tara:strand:+ start:400 stop:1047 length:648 start_codon:yes stop_codon:yes gene_type:complete
MALPTSGSISLNQMHTEVGGTSGTTASINDADIRNLVGFASGATMKFDEFYGGATISDVNLSMVVGHRDINNSTQYITSVSKERGYSDGPVTGNVAYGTFPTNAPTGYLGAGVFKTLKILGTFNISGIQGTSGTLSLHMTPATGLPNSNVSFKEVVIHGTSFLRSASTYVSNSSSSTTLWSWGNVATGPVPGLSSQAFPPFPAAGTTITVTFKRN